MLPVMSPAFEPRPPSLTIGIGVAVFGVELAETEVPVAFEVLEVLYRSSRQDLSQDL